VLGVARQVDNRKEVVSLWKLLKDIKVNASIITRDWFADQYEPNLSHQIGEQHFAEHFGSKSELDAAIVDNRFGSGYAFNLARFYQGGRLAN
jgi:hypothetical protein